MQFSLILSLLLLILAGPRYWYASIPITILATAGLVFRSLRTSKTLWLVLGLAVASSNIRHWYVVDNHKHLMAYWCGAVCLCLHAADPKRAIAENGRWLLGLVFLLATFWKVVSVEFISGDFIHFTMLFDPRFEELTRTVGTLEEGVVRENREGLRALVSPLGRETSATFTSSSALAWFSTGLTWWTIVLEGLIAVAFLSRPSPTFGHVALLLFIFTTYFIAPVLGFGYLLVALGISQLNVGQQRLKLAYLAAFVALKAYASPLPSAALLGVL